MQAIATVCANGAHTSRVRRIARRRKLPLIYILGAQVFVPPDKPLEPGRTRFDCALDSRELISSLRKRFKDLGIKEIEYHPPPDPRLYVYGDVLKFAAKRRAKFVIVERKPDPQPA